MKHLKRCVACAALTAAMSLAFVCSAFAAETQKDVSELPVKLVVDSEYIDGKVNDPVSKKSKSAFIVTDNAQFHLEENTEGAAETVQLVFYVNQYAEGHDKGTLNRILMKELALYEDCTMLPEDEFEEQLADGAAYDFINRCYTVRVYLDEAQSTYKDYYFGLVDELTYERMYQEMLEQEALEEARMG